MHPIENLFGFRQITFGRIDDPTSLCERKEYSYEDVVYDEIMQCQMGHEQKCFSTQETTFTSYNVSSFVSYIRIIPEQEVDDRKSNQGISIH